MAQEIAPAVTGNIPMILIGSCKRNGPGSHTSYFDDFDKEL